MADTSDSKKQVFEDIFDVLANTQFVNREEFVNKYEFEIDNDKGEITLRDIDTNETVIVLTYH